ncbi:MAG: Holliday junction branch migration protein RuvA [Bacilli bacterium]
MYQYIKGIVTEVEPNYIVIENSGIGYKIYTPNPFVFTLDDEYKVYLYQQIKEDEHTLFGFKTAEEKQLFLKLISVKGLGPKMTLPILLGSVNGIVDAIERENILYLKKFPKIGDKLAKQMILDLKGKLTLFGNVQPEVSNMDELVEVLKGLGYKEKDFRGILPKVNQELTIEEQVKEALKLLLK